jgi:hypothetical protein
MFITPGSGVNSSRGSKQAQAQITIKAKATRDTIHFYKFSKSGWESDIFHPPEAILGVFESEGEDNEGSHSLCLCESDSEDDDNLHWFSLMKRNLGLTTEPAVAKCGSESNVIGEQLFIC